MIVIVIANTTIIIIIIKTEIKPETSQGYHITTTNTNRCPCKMWPKRIWSCTAGLQSKCADREMSAQMSSSSDAVT